MRMPNGKILLCSALVSILTSSVMPAGQPSELFPAIDGWKMVKEVTVYTSDNLWDVIDGAAELYLAYGFVDLNIAEYQKPGVADIRVELYRHKSSPDAFGIYSQERNPEYRFIDIGTEGYTEEGVLNFLCGIYYVKISTHQKGEAVRTATLSIGRDVEQHLKQTKGWPSPLTLFPRTGKEMRSESYIAVNFLGYAFLHAAYTARYAKPAPLSLFIIELDSPRHAEQMLKKYLEALQLKAAPASGEVTLINDPNNGPVTVLLQDRYLCGAYNCSDPKARELALAELRKGLSEKVRP
jgi:hypothetical protein